MMERLEIRQLLSGGGAPNGPYVMTANVGSGTAVQLAFYDSADNETGFVVERSTGGGAFTPVANLAPSADVHGQVFYTDSATAAGVSYAYRAYAVNGIYQSSIAGPVTVTTPGTPPPAARVTPYGVPDGPYALTVNANAAASFDLSFYDSATNEAGFVIERSLTADGGFAPIATLNASPGRGGVVTYTDASAASTPYYYRVYAFNGDYTSTIHGPVQPVTLQAANLGGSTLLVSANPITPPNLVVGSLITPPNLVANNPNVGTLQNNRVGDLIGYQSGGNINIITGSISTRTFTGSVLLNNAGAYNQNQTSGLNFVSGLGLNNLNLGLGSIAQTGRLTTGGTLMTTAGAGIINLNASTPRVITISGGYTLQLDSSLSGPVTVTNNSDVVSNVVKDGVTYPIAPHCSFTLNAPDTIGTGQLLTTIPPLPPDSASASQAS